MREPAIVTSGPVHRCTVVFENEAKGTISSSACALLVLGGEATDAPW